MQKIKLGKSQKIAEDVGYQKKTTKNRTKYKTMEQEITPTSHPLSWLELLECELTQAKEDLLSSQAPRVSHSDIEDVSDAYQERLEYNWWVEEQKELIKDLEVKIKEHKATLSSEQLKLWESFNS